MNTDGGDGITLKPNTMTAEEEAEWKAKIEKETSQILEPRIAPALHAVAEGHLAVGRALLRLQGETPHALPAVAPEKAAQIALDSRSMRTDETGPHLLVQGCGRGEHVKLCALDVHVDQIDDWQRLQQIIE